MITVGIDPGAKGAAAVLEDGEFLNVIDYEEGPVNVIEWFFQLGIDHAGIDLVVLELVGAGAFGTAIDKRTGRSVPRSMGAVSAFNFGANYGWWKGLLGTLQVPWIEVRPQEWQKGLVPRKKNKTDKPSLEVARRLFPEAPLNLKKHDGRADALLISLYGFRSIKGFTGK